MTEFFENNSELLTSYAVKVGGVLIALFVGWIIAAWASRATGKALQRAHFDETLGKFVAKSVRWAILLFVILGCLGLFGVNVTTFAAVIGAASLAIGLAFQGSLSNLASGIMLLIFRPFKVGQVVNIGGQVGKVDEIELFTTTLDTPDNRRIIMPNGQVFGAVIENISHHETRRVDVAVGCDYSADLDRTREVLMAAAADVPGRLDDPGPVVVLAGLGASSVDWSVRVWADAADFFAIKEALMRSVKMALDDAGIGIPFPQMDVHLDQVAGTGA